MPSKPDSLRVGAFSHMVRRPSSITAKGFYGSADSLAESDAADYRPELQNILDPGLGL